MRAGRDKSTKQESDENYKNAINLMRIILLYCLDEYQKPQTTISRDPRDDMWLKHNCPFGIKRYDGGFLFHLVIYPNYPLPFLSFSYINSYQVSGIHPGLS